MKRLFLLGLLAGSFALAIGGCRLDIADGHGGGRHHLAPLPPILAR
jgi:hypothetical protein